MQALYTLHKSLVGLADSSIKKYIILEPMPTTAKSSENHIIKIKHDLDDETLKKSEPISAFMPFLKCEDVS